MTRIEQELPEPPLGPARQLLSVDGALVPLVGGVWAEVKTLALGAIEEPVIEAGEQAVHSTALSYFSRMTDAETFQRLALVETHRRGVETAQHVIAPTDGAVWIQGFLDYHRPDAQRILDFGHPAGYVATIGGVVGLPESAAFQSWLKTSLHTLKHDGATAVLPELQAQVTAHPEQAELAEALTYLEKRTAMMNYPEYQRQGWPIGSGSVESGNKVVVEARLKGAGMHWAPSHVNPMLSLRNAICSERWHEAWQAIVADHRRQRCQRFLNRARRNTVAPLPPPLPALPKLQNQSKPSDVSAAEPKEHWRPAANHPWKSHPSCSPSHRSRSAKM